MRNMMPRLRALCLPPNCSCLGHEQIPKRSRRFLDFFGSWDPTLALLHGGAVCHMAVSVGDDPYRRPVRW